jgi:hypothetical protein
MMNGELKRNQRFLIHYSSFTIITAPNPPPEYRERE